MHPRGSDSHTVAPVRGVGDPAGPGGRSTGPRCFASPAPGSATAPRAQPIAQPIAQHRRGYPRALTGSNPGGGGSGGGRRPLRTRGAHLPAGACRVGACPARAGPSSHLRARGRAVVLPPTHSEFGVPEEHERAPDSLQPTRSQTHVCEQVRPAAGIALGPRGSRAAGQRAREGLGLHSCEPAEEPLLRLPPPRACGGRISSWGTGPARSAGRRADGPEAHPGGGQRRPAQPPAREGGVTAPSPQRASGSRQPSGLWRCCHQGLGSCRSRAEDTRLSSAHGGLRKGKGRVPRGAWREEVSRLRVSAGIPGRPAPSLLGKGPMRIWLTAFP